MYDAESGQENFLVLAGTCLLVVEEQERPLRAWDFVHCPSGTAHVFVGTGDGPCVILMVGARRAGGSILYPRSEVALGHDAAVTTETPTARGGVRAVPRVAARLPRGVARAALGLTRLPP